jgi:hypothetical protein
MITRLEETGDPSAIPCGILQRILDARAVTIPEILCEQEPTWCPGANTAAKLGALLIERGKAVPVAQVAQQLEVPPPEVEHALCELSARLQPVGIRVDGAFSGVRLVPAVRMETSASSDITRHLA